MKKNTIILLFILTCIFKPIGLIMAAPTDSIPEGAIAFEYIINTKPVIFIPGILNDSIPIRCYFETGWGVPSFSDSLASNFELKHDIKKLDEVQKTMKVHIGTCEQTYGKSNRANYIKRNIKNVFMTPWTFFDKKIIEISFSRHYFRELPNTNNLSKYDVVKMEVDGALLKIPVAVSVQGKVIKEFVALDTGYGDGIEFIGSIASKYSIKKDSNTLLGDAFVGYPLKHHSFMRMPADTIKTGNSFLTEGQYVNIELTKSSVYPFSGIIGLGFFKNFDIVFDFKNYILYLKPIEKH
jgi:hypothetical protein